MGMLDHKVLIVTGGGNGIGRATAVACAREGAQVMIADIDAEAGELTAKMITEFAPGCAQFIRADVSNRTDISNMVDETVEVFGRLDGAFNNAGIEGMAAPVDECTDANWERVIDVNLSSVFRCMQAEIPEIVANGGGSIVNCASVAGLVGFAGLPAYVASKHGVVGLTKAAALDLASRKVRVNAICPGVIDTEMVERFTHGDPVANAAMVAMEPVGRMGKPEEIAELAVWLLSDRSGFVTGDAIADDGGFVAR